MSTVLNLLPRRRGRSARLFTFGRQPLAAPIQSLLPYPWEDALVVQNVVVMWREDFDPVYRGDVHPDESCAQNLARHPWDIPDGEEDQFSDIPEFVDTRPTTPELVDTRPTTPELSDTRPTTPELADTRPTTPEFVDTRFTTPEPAGPLEFASSPLTPSGEVSPTLTEVANGWRPNFKTYSRRDRKRFLAERAERETKEAHAKAEAKAKAAANKREKELALAARRQLRPTRRSARLRRYRDNPADPEVWTMDKLVQNGHVIYPVDPEATTPLIDEKGYVMALIAGPPKGEKLSWVHLMQHADKAMGRVYRNTVFPNLGREESRVRFGIGFGEIGAEPHQINVKSCHLEDVAYIQASAAFQKLSAYQNHVFCQIAPKAYADLEHKMSLLKAQTGMCPAFPDSVFTTSEIAFGDGPQLSRKNRDAQFDTMEAITVGGDYAWEQGRAMIIFWDDYVAIPLRPGTTVLYPTGTKRQFCHAGVLRWIDKGFQSDEDFATALSEEGYIDFQTGRQRRGQTGIHKYTKINDIYVV
ncbi:hypothetical protein B0H11DRAFT_1911570 [Mycena galericulata]|nr:hypothetical protein B0H11DRAFT_1911570 [Mycena galericulata]